MATADGAELKNKSSFKYTSPVRFGVLTNGSIMRDATVGSNSSGSSRPSEETQNDDYKYRDLSETTSDSTTDGLPPSSSSSAATDVPPLPQVDAEPAVATTDGNYPSSPAAKIQPCRNTNISSLPLPSPRKNPPISTPMPVHTPALSLHTPISVNDYTSEDEGGFRPRQSIRGSPPPRRQLSQHFSSFRYLPPPPQYRTNSNESTPPQYQHQSHQHQQSYYQQNGGTGHQTQQNGGTSMPNQQNHQPQQNPPVQQISRVNGSLSHGTVRSVKKRRHISFV